MGNSTHFRSGRLQLVLLLLVALGAGLGCVGPTGPTGRGAADFDYFAAPEPGEAWSRKIRGWQSRQRAAQGREPHAVSEPQPSQRPRGERRGEALANKYERFRSDRRREMARELADWIQAQALEHYIEDGPIDHWATLEETLQGNGDDCDGLELLTYNLLADLGFHADEVFRAVVYRVSDGQHHMVTLWFENRDDPWVIDPTGAMTSGMPRMSEVPGWVPIKVFSENADYTVRTPSIAVR